MHESIEQIFTYLRGIWRFRWTAMLVAWVIALSGWVWVSFLPDKFESNTRIFIDTDSVLRPLLKGLAVETDVEQRLQLMTRTLLSRPNLERLIRMTDLDLNIKTPIESEKLILSLQNNIQIKNINPTKKKGVSNFYEISYEHRNRSTAELVVQSLLNILVESSLGDTRQDSTSARAFLEKQIQEYEDKLRSSEDRLGNFKRKNMAFLPENEGGYFNQLREMQTKFNAAQLELRESQNRRDTLIRQIDDFRATGVAPIESTEVVKSPLQERLQIAYTKLDELLLRFTEQHPDVKELRIQINALEAQVKKEKESQDVSKEADLLESNPLYQQLRLSLGQEESNIGAIQVRVNEYTDRINNLNRQIEQLQQIEIELKRLDRDYALNKKNYEELVTRRESAQLAGEAEKTGNSIQFRVIDPPWVPETPSGPKRVILDGLVLIFAIGGGLGLSFLLSQNSPSFYNRKSLQGVTGIPVFGSVSRVYSHRESISNRIFGSIYVMSGVMLLVVFVSVVFVQKFEYQYITALQSSLGRWL